MENRLPERMVARREALKISRKELADMLKTSETQIWRYETGKNDPTVAIALKLSDALSVSIDWLVGLSEAQEVRNPERYTTVAQIPLPGGRKIDITHQIEKLDDLESEAIHILRAKSLQRRSEILEILRKL